VKINKFIDELKHLFSRGWNSRHERTLVDCIHDDVIRALCLEGEHFFETFYHSSIIRLPNSMVVSRIESGEDVTIGIRASGELDEEGRKQIAEFLLVDVPEVEIKIGHRGLPCIV